MNTYFITQPLSGDLILREVNRPKLEKKLPSGRKISAWAPDFAVTIVKQVQEPAKRVMNPTRMQETFLVPQYTAYQLVAFGPTREEALAMLDRKGRAL